MEVKIFSFNFIHLFLFIKASHHRIHNPIFAYKKLEGCLIIHYFTGKHSLQEIVSVITEPHTAHPVKAA